MTTVTSTAPDFQAIQRRQQATWASGDFSRVASRILFSAELLCETADLKAGWKVLDVATGSGNAALAAARRGCEAVGTDYVPALLERGRIRAAADHLDVTFIEADAGSQPFADGTFDAVTSIYGCMFAPDHKRVAAELARVCKPGGRIALASWTPTGFIGDMFKMVGRYLPPPAGLTPPVRWGEEAYLKELFGCAIKSIRSQVRTCVMRYKSPEDNVQFFKTYYGPTLKTFAALNPADQESLAKDMANLVRSYDRDRTGPVAIHAEYLESVIERA